MAAVGLRKPRRGRVSVASESKVSTVCAGTSYCDAVPQLAAAVELQTSTLINPG